MKKIEAILANCPLTADAQILQAHPAGLIAVNKPAGVPSHPNEKGGDASALICADYDPSEEAYRWKDGDEERKAWLLHRLDSPTSGVILLAFNSEIAHAVQELFARRKVRKIYHAVVVGRPAPLPDVWVNRLEKRRQGQGVRMVAGTRLEAKTRLKIRSKDPNGNHFTLVELEPLTGRTHQLRVQCALRGCPILGDRTYGHFETNRILSKAIGTKRLFLHSSSIAFQLQHMGALVKFKADAALPEEFNQVMQPSKELRELRLPSVKGRTVRHRFSG